MKKWILALLIALVASFSMNAEVIKLVGNAVSMCEAGGEWSDWVSGKISITLNTSNDVAKISFGGNTVTLKCYDSSDWEENADGAYETTMFCTNVKTGESTDITLEISSDNDLVVYLSTPEGEAAINVPSGGIIRNYKAKKSGSKKSSKKKRRR